MAVKKSELYSSIWASCDELRGGMDASQYKDYILPLLFLKYVSDKYAGREDALIYIPEGASFRDLVAMRGKAEIGEAINKALAAIDEENGFNMLTKMADFNDEDNLGKGKELTDRLSKLIGIFDNPNLDFSNNRAEDDDLLGDAYEYLMRHFATESGKSKGQFYTPSEVSQIMAKVIGIENSGSASDTLYDMTCGSGSLLLRAADLAPHGISIYGQEKDNTTRALAVMNMWLHGRPASEIVQGNTLSDPQFKGDKSDELKTFDYIVANPPFSDKAWSNGLIPDHDEFERFDGFGIPPTKNGDYAYLLHLIKSLKSDGKAAIILPLGVLFRGNAEAVIRKQILQRGYIKGIIALPANLFYGTGIAASIVVIDKESAAQRKGIFMIDADGGFMKDGPKNRLRSQDIHRIVDVFNKQQEIDKYSRLVPLHEIADPKNDYNLNIPRYIDSQEEEDKQDIAAHLQGGIPSRDVDALHEYWDVYSSMKKTLFQPSARPNFWDLTVAPEEIKNTIFNHSEFEAYSAQMQMVFDQWKDKNSSYLSELDKGALPKDVIHHISEDLFVAYHNKALVDPYHIYQIIMDYWAEIMQDDLYELGADGWKAGNEVKRLMRKAAKKGGKDRAIDGLIGLQGRLIPPSLIIQEYFATEQATLDELNSQVETAKAAMEELAEEQTEDGELVLEDAATDKGNLTKASINARIKELTRKTADNAEEWTLLQQYKKLMDKETKLKTDIKMAEQDLEKQTIKQYPRLSIDEIKTLVVDNKWMATLENRIATEMDAISYRLTERIKELAERYETPLPTIIQQVEQLRQQVNKHLLAMGYKEMKA